MRKNEKLKNIGKDNYIIGLSVIILGVFLFATIASPKVFLSQRNFTSMAYQFPEFGIMSLGMMICMILGGIDLSIVGIANLSGITAAKIIISFGEPDGKVIVLSIIGALAVGAICGLFNAFLIGHIGIPAMLVTLCGLQIYTGIGLAITKGPALTGIPESFQQIGNGLVFGTVPISLLIFIFIAVFIWYLLKYTVYGQQLFMAGSNPIASKYAGINNYSLTIKTHVLSGILAAISGIIMCSHYGSAKSDYGSTYTLLTLLIVILGGVNPSGGKGKVSGVVLAIIIIQIISGAFSILRFNSFIKTFMFGLILICIMIVQNLDQLETIIRKMKTKNILKKGVIKLEKGDKQTREFR